MSEPRLTVREMEYDDVMEIVNYWTSADENFLRSMGADILKLPDGEQLKQMLLTQILLPYEKKKSYCIIWEIDGMPAGHCNTNPTVFGEEAYMHLHLGRGDNRHRGLGARFVRMTLPYFFHNLKLKRLFSEPYAMNPGPNKTLEKAGFTLEKEYITTPGAINFEQLVKRWELTLDAFKALYGEPALLVERR